MGRPVLSPRLQIFFLLFISFPVMFSINGQANLFPLPYFQTGDKDQKIKKKVWRVEEMGRPVLSPLLQILFSLFFSFPCIVFDKWTNQPFSSSLFANRRQGSEN